MEFNDMKGKQLDDMTPVRRTGHKLVSSKIDNKVNFETGCVLGMVDYLQGNKECPEMWLE